MATVTDDTHPIHVSPQALERIAAVRPSGLPLATFLALLAKLDSTGHAQITQPELCALLHTGAGKVWQSLQTLVAAGVIDPPDARRGLGRRTPYRIRPDVAVAPSIPPRPRRRRPTWVAVDQEPIAGP